MRRLQFKFPSQIRISGWDFGSSARAMNQAGGKDSLMTYLRVFFIQAEPGKGLGSTFERKTMSKTFKRVALVAVTALVAGSFSAVSASAAPSAAYTTMYDTTNGYQVVGGLATVTITTDTSTVASVVLSGAGSVVSATAGTNTSLGGTPSTGTYSVTTTSSGAGTSTVVLTSAATGTSTLTITPYNSNGTVGTAVTKAVTWVASTTIAPSVTNSTSFIGSGTTAASADVAVTADKAAGTQVANVAIVIKDANGNALNGQTLSATISGPGLIAFNQSSATQAGTARAASLTLTSSQNSAYLGISSDGTAGVSTITISAGSTVISTETVTFTGSAASYTATNTASVYSATGAVIGSGTAQTITVSVKDAAGNAVVNGTTVYASSSDTTVAAITASATTTSGVATFTVTGAKVGSAVITFGNAASSPTLSITDAITVGSATVAKVSLSLDDSSYVPGQAATLTVSAVDASGNAVADGNYTLFSVAGASSLALAAGSLPAASTAYAFVGGKKTFAINMPLTAGTVKITATDNLTALNALSVSATVSGSSEAAIDAANEATDAANAATDAANAAAEAADAATAAAQDAQAAVAALATQVASLIAGIKAQITTLTNLVIKIQKKVRA